MWFMLASATDDKQALENRDIIIQELSDNEVKIANDVKVPNKTVGEKFEKLKIMNPIEIVSAVYKIALPIVVCDLRIASLGATPLEISNLYLYK